MADQSPHPPAHAGIIWLIEHMQWLDGSPLIDQFPPFQQRLFEQFASLDEHGRLRYRTGLWGRGKKQAKSLSAVMYGLWKMLLGQSPRGNDVALIANSKNQAAQSLELSKRLVEANLFIRDSVVFTQNGIRRNDNTGSMIILPGQASHALHGKSLSLVIFDEIWSFQNYELFEALALDPHRPEAQLLAVSYDGPYREGTPLFDLKKKGFEGTDKSLLFSWYAASCTTDKEWEAKVGDDPIARANPCMELIPNFKTYIENQRRILPTSMFRRLHLNEGQGLLGSFLDPDKIMACVAEGRKFARPQPEVIYRAFVDLSGGSHDDCVLAIGTKIDGKVVLVRILSQQRKPPFDPRIAVNLFASVLKEYGLNQVYGDAFAGSTFLEEFRSHGITYKYMTQSATALYESLEPLINSQQIELLDEPKLLEQLMGLVQNGSKVTHPTNARDDFANACAGCAVVAAKQTSGGGELSFAYLETASTAFWSYGNVGADPVSIFDVEDEDSFWAKY